MTTDTHPAEGRVTAVEAENGWYEVRINGAVISKWPSKECAGLIVQRIAAALTPPQTEPGGTVREAAIAGWNACRKSIYAVCEDVMTENEKHRKDSENPPRHHFGRGGMTAAKSIARGFNSMEAEDDDNLVQALDAISATPATEARVDGWQDISTAPKDGTKIIILTADKMAIEGYWDSSVENFYKSQKGWASYDPENAQGDWVSIWLAPGDCRLFCGQTPKFWMPRPAPPSLTQPEREAQEAVADVMDQHLAAIAIASSYGGDEGWCWLRRYQSGDPECAAQAQAFDGRKFATPPDAAETIARKSTKVFCALLATGVCDQAERANRLEDEAARLREAVKPFGEYYGPHHLDTDNRGVPLPDGDGVGWVYLTVGDFRRAHAALDQPARDEVRG